MSLARGDREDTRNRAVWIGFGGEKVAELGSGNDVEVNLRVD